MELYWPQGYHQRFVNNKTLLFLLFSSPDALFPKFAGMWACDKHDEEKEHDFAMLVFKVRFCCCATKLAMASFLSNPSPIMHCIPLSLAH